MRTPEKGDQGRAQGDLRKKNASPHCLQEQDIDPGVVSRHRAFHQRFGGLLWAKRGVIRVVLPV